MPEEGTKCCGSTRGQSHQLCQQSGKLPQLSLEEYNCRVSQTKGRKGELGGAEDGEARGS